MQSPWKELTTDSHVYFLTGPFSQWHPSTFTAALPVSRTVLKFNCGEQYMMASKADLFGDEVALEKIMAVQPVEGRPFREVPDAQKKLGRSVRNFDQDVWAANDEAIVFQGNLAKFTQNHDLHAYLFQTGARHLVEGASYDPIWGVGLAWNDPLIQDEKNWKGQKKLGKTVMRVRAHISERWL